MDAQVVYEHDEAVDMHSGPYGYERVGLRIEERVIWFACDSGSSQKEREEFKRWESVAYKLVGALQSQVDEPRPSRAPVEAYMEPMRSENE